MMFGEDYGASISIEDLCQMSYCNICLLSEEGVTGRYDRGTVLNSSRTDPVMTAIQILVR